MEELQKEVAELQVIQYTNTIINMCVLIYVYTFSPEIINFFECTNEGRIIEGNVA